MKNLKRTLVMLTAAALTFGASAEERIWNFSNGLDGWRLSGGWDTKGGVLQQTADDRPYAYAIVGESDWDVRYISAKVRIDAPFRADDQHKIGVIFRANFPPDIGPIFRPKVLPDKHIRCYIYELSPRDDFTFLMTARIHERGGVSGVGRGGPVHGGIELESGEWYQIKIVLKGKNIDFFINESWQRSEDEADYVETGAVGFFTFFAKASFDDLIVEGEYLQGGRSQPNGKLAAQWARLKLE